MFEMWIVELIMKIAREAFGRDAFGFIGGFYLELEQH